MRRQVINKKSVVSRKKQKTEENQPEEPVEEEKSQNDVTNSEENVNQQDKINEDTENHGSKKVKGNSGLIESEINNETNDQIQEEKILNKADNKHPTNNIVDNLGNNNQKSENDDKKEKTHNIRRCIIHKYFPWLLIIIGITIGGYTIFRRYKK